MAIFDLILRINGQQTLRQAIGKATSDQGWATIDRTTDKPGRPNRQDRVGQPADRLDLARGSGLLGGDRIDQRVSVSLVRI